jgi:D-3-phosphoglycerate dehydrogenase
METKELEGLRAFLRLGEILGSLQCQMAEGQMREIRVHFEGGFEPPRTGAITTAVVKGILQRSASSGTVNDINARALAAERGWKVYETLSASSGDYVHLVSVACVSSKGSHRVEGTVFGKNDVRIVAVDGFRLNAAVEVNGLLYTNDDRPGMISAVSTVLAKNRVNIAKSVRWTAFTR